VVLGADAEVRREVLPDREGAQHGPDRVAQRDDQVPPVGGVVQPEVEDREVRRLPPVHVEERDGLQGARVQPAVDGEQLGGVRDEAGVGVGAEVLALRLGGRSQDRVVAGTPTGGR
jgi:hypothetical protein